MLRRHILWREIEWAYRHGTDAISKIARQFGVSEATVRSRAERFDWQREGVAARVNELVQRKLALNGRLTLDPEQPDSDEKLIDNASDVGVASARRAQRTLGEAHETAADFLTELLNVREGRPALLLAVEEAIAGMPWLAPKEAEAQRLRLMGAIDIEPRRSHLPGSRRS